MQLVFFTEGSHIPKSFQKLSNTLSFFNIFDPNKMSKIEFLPLPSVIEHSNLQTKIKKQTTVGIYPNNHYKKLYNVCSLIWKTKDVNNIPNKTLEGKFCKY